MFSTKYTGSSSALTTSPVGSAVSCRSPFSNPIASCASSTARFTKLSGVTPALRVDPRRQRLERPRRRVHHHRRHLKTLRESHRVRSPHRAERVVIQRDARRPLRRRRRNPRARVASSRPFPSRPRRVVSPRTAARSRSTRDSHREFARVPPRARTATSTPRRRRASRGDVPTLFRRARRAARARRRVARSTRARTRSTPARSLDRVDDASRARRRASVRRARRAIATSIDRSIDRNSRRRVRTSKCANSRDEVRLLFSSEGSIGARRSSDRR